MSFRIELEREEDGRWIAEIPDLPGVLAYGATREDAMARAEALAMSVIAESRRSRTDNFDQPVELPIDGVLDLHTFQPRDVKPLVNDYLDACRERGILDVRIVHGKGIGMLRDTVHAVLRARDDVEEFRLAPEDRGGWGATIVRLKTG